MSAAFISFTLCLGDFIRTLGCVTSRFDAEMWMKNDPNCDDHSFMSIHVDDFAMIRTDTDLLWKHSNRNSVFDVMSLIQSLISAWNGKHSKQVNSMFVTRNTRKNMCLNYNLV